MICSVSEHVRDESIIQLLNRLNRFDAFVIVNFE